MRPRVLGQGTRIAVRIDLRDREKLEAVARSKDITLSKLLRKVIRNYVRRAKV